MREGFKEGVKELFPIIVWLGERKDEGKHMCKRIQIHDVYIIGYTAGGCRYDAMRWDGTPHHQASHLYEEKTSKAHNTVILRVALKVSN